MMKTLVERDAKLVATNQKLRFFPATITGGTGAVVTDGAGNQLLDMTGSWGAHGVGYANPRVTEAINRAASRASGASILSSISPEPLDLAEKILAEHTEPEDKRVLFGLSGSDANTSAISAVRLSTGRNTIVSFHGSYHGGFGVARGLSGLFVDGGETRDPDSVWLKYPSCDLTCVGETCAARSRESLEELQAALETHTVAAVIVEPIQADGGILNPHPGYFAKAAALIRQAGALLIMDEVKVGSGRTGKFHAFAHEDVTPDIVTYGKAIGGGLPLSLVVGPSSVLSSVPASSLLTAAGNAVSCAAGAAVLESLHEDGLIENAAVRGSQLRAEVAELRGASAVAEQAIRDTRGRGLAVGIELVDPEHPESQRSAAEFTHRVIFRMWELGVMAFLVRDNVIEFTPPLVLSDSQVSQAIETLGLALSDVKNGAVPPERLVEFAGW